MSHSAAAVACTPNFSGAGRRRRQRVAAGSAIAAGALLVAFVVMGVPAPMRFIVALPAAVAFVSWLQVRRNTCVAHAATGTFENEDFSVEKVDAARAAASKKVAATIVRDGVVAGLAVGLAAVGTGYLG